MTKPKKDKKKPNVKLSQKQKQSVVVNVLLAKSRAPRRPSGKKALPVFIQPPIRMIVSSGDIMNRQPPNPQFLGEDIRKLIQLEVKNPIAELRQDFLNRIESRPKTEIMENPFTDEMMKRIREDNLSMERTLEMFGEGERDRTDVFEPRFIDGASIEMLMKGDYGITKTGNKRIAPTKKQRDAINKFKSV